MAAVEQTRQQITEYKRFRTLARDLVETSEQLCDAQLRTPEAISPEAAKKHYCPTIAPSDPRNALTVNEFRPFLRRDDIFIRRAFFRPDA